MGITATRYHDISMGHRVFEHKSKCAHLHGHNYRIWFTLEIVPEKIKQPDMVMDFGLIKELLCEWLEKHWDHSFLIFDKDPWLGALQKIDYRVFEVPFNPTAENMATFLGEVIAPELLKPHNVRVAKIQVDETRKCSATWTNPLSEMFW